MRKIYNLVYKISEGVRYGVFIKVDEPILKKIINKEIDYNDFCISLTKKQIMHNEKRVDFEVFTIDLINESIITKDNIHLYYEFMSDEDIKKYRHIIMPMFNDRLEIINKSIKLDAMYISAISLSVFGIKDTLKPMEEYIAEIKASKEYLHYMSSKLA